MISILIVLCPLRPFCHTCAIVECRFNSICVANAQVSIFCTLLNERLNRYIDSPAKNSNHCRMRAFDMDIHQLVMGRTVCDSHHAGSHGHTS